MGTLPDRSIDIFSVTYELFTYRHVRLTTTAAVCWRKVHWKQNIWLQRPFFFTQSMRRWTGASLCLHLWVPEAWRFRVVRPSVRSTKYHLSIRVWVQPNNPGSFSARPSVHPERLPGISRKMHERNYLQYDMLSSPWPPSALNTFGYGLLIFLILALFWLSGTGQIWGFRSLRGERMERITWNLACWCILYADVPLAALMRLWLRSIDFPNFYPILTSWNGEIWGLWAFPGERIEGMASVLLAGESRQPSELIEVGHGLWIFFLVAPLWLCETGQFGGSGHFCENAWREWPDIWHAEVSWPPSELIRFWSRCVDFTHFGATLT